MKNQPLIFIVGPTAVGKSNTALALARRIEGEIVSCDAMQVYQEINIASDKPSTAVLKEIPHHCLNIISVKDDFDVAQYRVLAIQAIEDIQRRGKTAIVVGGTGMYMSVLLDGIFEGNTRKEDLRAELIQRVEISGVESLYEELKKLDPQAAQKIHPHHSQRIIRALEVYRSTGESITRLQEKREGLWGGMPIKIFALNRERQELYRRVEERIDEMFTRGLVEEVKAVLELPLSRTAKTLIGIPEVGGFLRGEHSLERAVYLMKLHTRHYVKRQLTWFRRDQRIEWMDGVSSVEEIVDQISAYLK